MVQSQLVQIVAILNQGCNVVKKITRRFVKSMTKIGRYGQSRDIFIRERSMQYSLSL